MPGLIGAAVLAAGLALPQAGPLSAIGLTPAPAVQASAPQQRPAKPNIVVVMADDMRVDELLFMPSLRATVARHGLTFQNSFSPYPLCCPARASFLTGRYAHNHRVYWHEAPYGYGAFDDSRT
ncbi:MAG: sulfatase-like hydrolase/transferase, partial [Nocardioides sp.]|nr:sulfatase-like hydrolase/transferase [Nocardioides sp.]